MNRPVTLQVNGRAHTVSVEPRALLVHDPASDMPAVMLALDAELQLRSKQGGRRAVRAREFLDGPFATKLAEDEILSDIRITSKTGRGAAYVSFDQAASGYALVGCAVLERK
jgi:aerobic carbon-monoxide dehydrogenase medium subunit